MTKIYLREITKYATRFPQTTFDIFSGNIKKDKLYWREYQKQLGAMVTARYFLLKEVKK